MMKAIPQIVVLLFSIIFHEVAHGKAALIKGDTTARDAGRLTLNPLPHIDIFGTIIFPLILVIIKSPVLFGWAKPVPVNPLRLKDIKKDMVFVGAAGPASNIFLAVVSGILFRIFSAVLSPGSVLLYMAYFAVYINLVLAFFNLVPIPPLDGSRIVMGFMPDDIAVKFMKLERFGFMIIFGLLFLGFFTAVIFPVVIFFLRLLTGIAIH
ncbi:site-2 protease family protein [bacterium]|nr:site-2 protease family protein [bacterium]